MTSREEPELGSRTAVALDLLARLPRRGLLVDLGCGPGALLARVEGLRLGVDRSRGALRELGASAPTAWRVQADHDDPHLPLRSESVGVCIMLDALPYLGSPRSFLLELARVMEPGGWLLVSVPNARQIPHLIALARGRPVVLSKHEAPFDVGQRHLFTDAALRDLLEAAGFACEELIGLLPAPRGGWRSLALRVVRRSLGRAWLAPGVLVLARRISGTKQRK